MLHMLAKENFKFSSILLGDSVCELELQWDFLELYGVLEWSKLIAWDFQPTTWTRTYIGLHVEQETFLLSIMLERLYYLGEISCFQSNSFAIAAFISLSVGNSQANARKLNVLSGIWPLLWISCRNSLKNPLPVIYWSKNLTLCSRLDIFK